MNKWIVENSDRMRYRNGVLNKVKKTCRETERERERESGKRLNIYNNKFRMRQIAVLMQNIIRSI